MEYIVYKVIYVKISTPLVYLLIIKLYEAMNKIM